MLAQEPHLKLVGAKHLTDRQVIRTVIAQSRSSMGQLAAAADNDLMSIQES